MRIGGLARIGHIVVTDSARNITPNSRGSLNIGIKIKYQIRQLFLGYQARMLINSSGYAVLETPLNQNISHGRKGIAAFQTSRAAVRKNPLPKQRGRHLRY